MPEGSPSAPRMVVSAPLDTMTFTPPASMVRMAEASCSSENPDFIITTIFVPSFLSMTRVRNFMRQARTTKTGKGLWRMKFMRIWAVPAHAL